MPSLYGTTTTYTVTASNVSTLYLASTATAITSTVVSTNLGGLYSGLYGPLPSNAQALLNLLDNYGDVNFALDPTTGYTTVYAYTVGGQTTGSVRASISVQSGVAGYNSTTGVISVPTLTSQLINDSGYITNGSTGTSTVVLGNFGFQGNTVSNTINAGISLQTNGKIWTLDPSGIINLPATGAQNYLPPNGQLSDQYWVAPPNGQVNLASNNGENYVWVDDNGAYIGTNWNTTASAWTFNLDGTTQFPEYLFPKGHGTFGQALTDDGSGTLHWNTVSNVSTATVDIFSGNGVQTLFTLTSTPGDLNSMAVVVGGVSQTLGVAWTVTGKNLQFTSPPPAGTNNIVARYFSAYILNPYVVTQIVAGSNVVINPTNGTGVVTISALSTLTSTASWANLLGKNDVSGPTNIALGKSAGTSQAGDNIALGQNAGQNQSVNAIAIGLNAAQTNQKSNSIAIGANAAVGGLSTGSIMINATGALFNEISGQQNSFYVKPIRYNTGTYILTYNNTTGEITYAPSGGALGPTWNSIVDKTGPNGPTLIALGKNAGLNNTTDKTVAIGESAGNNFQGTYSVSIGYQAGLAINSTSSYNATDVISIGRQTNSTNGPWAGSIAIGGQAGQYGLGENSIAIGYQAANNLTAVDSISIGDHASYFGWGPGGGGSSRTIAIGYYAAAEYQEGQTIAIGDSAGRTHQRANATAIGWHAGYDTQSTFAIALGSRAGYQSQGPTAIAIGYDAGYTSQSNQAIALGYQSGYTNQGGLAVAIGDTAGRSNQGGASVAIGSSAGFDHQGTHAVAIGVDAGIYYQGTASIAIGALAGCAAGFTTPQPANSIVINATDTYLQATTSSSFFVKPIRHVVSATLPAGFRQMAYNPTTGEIIYWGT